MNRREFVTGAGSAALASAGGFPAILSGTRTERPNIVLILAEDMGPYLSCYGHPVVRTPNIDRLANEGVRFNNAFTTAPVCSPSRSAFNTGLYQTSIGAHHHRSHRKDGYRLPEGVRLITDRLRERGYFTANVRAFAEGAAGTGKTDFNFTVEKPFDGTHWNQREKGQPFYAQVNFREPHKGPAFVEARKQSNLVDPARVSLPPYYPDHPVVRDEIANFFDAIHLLDRKVGQLLDALKQDNLLDSTAIFFMGDNGTCLIRGKQWLYDEGIHVPLIARWPGVLKPGTVRDDLVLSLDMTAQTLEWAGIPIPKNFHGRPLFGSSPKRDYIVAARDRCDMTVDRIRCVRDKRYKYIRNFMPDRPYTQYNEYIQTSYPTLSVMKQLHSEGKLNEVQSLFMQPRKPEVEFYDLQTDKYEVKNLASAPEHRERVRKYADILDRWMKDTGDQGGIPETPEAAAI
jgi:Arylsulfatase A and related enzymes